MAFNINFEDFEIPQLTFPLQATPRPRSNNRTSLEEQEPEPTSPATDDGVAGNPKLRPYVEGPEETETPSSALGASQAHAPLESLLVPHGQDDPRSAADYECKLRLPTDNTTTEQHGSISHSREHDNIITRSVGAFDPEPPPQRISEGDVLYDGVVAKQIVDHATHRQLMSIESDQQSTSRPQLEQSGQAPHFDRTATTTQSPRHGPTDSSLFTSENPQSGETNLPNASIPGTSLPTITARETVPPAINITLAGYRTSRPSLDSSASPKAIQESHGLDPSVVTSDHRSPRRSSRSSPGGTFEIREVSRARSGSTVTNSSGEMCDGCKTVGPHRSYCNVCCYTFCDRCWEQQMPHRGKRLALGNIPHEKTAKSVAKKVQGILSPALTEKERERLHQADIDTTWFGVTRDEPGLPYPLFRDYGRYAYLIAEAKNATIGNAIPMSGVSNSEETLYPSLVSFVGETGAGKSTLIKLLIDLKSLKLEDAYFPTPVVGGVGRDIATSEDVHLYLEPETSTTQVPLLFADCEGLDGGEREPIGARLKRKMERETAAAGMRRRRGLKHTSERELTWADTPNKQSREFAVAHLYPRLLYTFSDVIVFVLKNPRRIEGVLKRLIEWASAALETSSNQPVLPHAIIALNASENNIAEQLWDVGSATTILMENLSSAIYNNADFKKYADFWRDRDRRVTTVDQLLKSYYSSVTVVRIPTGGRPNLINDQVEKLSSEIRAASKKARERKLSLRMLLDAEEFQPYLQVAFDHFAENLNEPFDFVQASFTYSPIPNDFGGNILKLAIRIMESWKDLAKGATIFEELSYMVASCITLDAARNKYKGPVDSFFRLYLDHIDAALDNFCDRHWPCEFVSEGGRCVNVRSGHGAKGHQLKSGKLLAAGDYTSAFTAESYQEKFESDIYAKMLALREKVQAREKPGILEIDAAAEVHKDLVLPFFCEHASRGIKSAFISHTVCFCCLFEPPEHPLPCGHIVCTSCLKTFGRTASHGRVVEIGFCPLERQEHFRKAWKVNLKPTNWGIRILTLDGGGIRGIVELEILKLVEKELGGQLSIQSFFDLVVGTSTGGIIALGLTARHWTVSECRTNFEAFVKQAFTHRKGANVPGVGWFVQNYNHSRYETQPLQEALVKAFPEDQYLFGGKRSESGSLDLKVAVTASSAASRAVVLTNYNRLCTERLPYDFQRPDQPSMELKTWEAARATSAAPNYFKPLCHEPSKQVYQDGGLWYNNPICVADTERRFIWPDQANEEPDIVVSIGTSFHGDSKPKRSMGRIGETGIVNNYRNRVKIAKDIVASTSDSQRIWQQFLQDRCPTLANKHRYVRLDLELDEPPPKLDEVDKMGRLCDQTTYKLGDSLEIQKLARRLVASCFYFDLTGGVKEDSEFCSYEVTGHINCRFLAGPEVNALGNFIQAKAQAGHNAHFIIKEEGNEHITPQKIYFDERIMRRMLRDHMFRTERLTIGRNNPSSKTDISLCFTRGETFPISGFPRCLHSGAPSQTATIAATSTAPRHALKATHSFRWLSRSTSQQQQRRHWQPPTVLSALPGRDMIAHYSDPNHLLGSATREEPMSSPPVASNVNLPYLQALPVNPINPAEMPTTENPVDRFYIVTDDWRPSHNVDGRYLAVRQGDLVKVSEKSNSDWWVCRLPHEHSEAWLPSRILKQAPSDAATTFEYMEKSRVNAVYLSAELGT